MIQNLIKEVVRPVFQQTEGEASVFRNSEEGRNFDWKTLFILILTACSLSLIYYGSKVQNIAAIISFLKGNDLAANYISFFKSHTYGRLFTLTQWIFFTAIGYLLIPMLFIRFYLKEPIRNFGFSGQIQFKDLKIYGWMLLIMIPLVFLVSYTVAFQQKYPFYVSESGNWDLSMFCWEIEYFFQFFALEFFFRGFLLHGIKHRFGFYSVLVMAIPYCMIHFGKPFPETIAAILAGIALGILSLKSKNIWLGFFIHCTVALLMDILSMWQKGFFFVKPYP